MAAGRRLLALANLLLLAAANQPDVFFPHYAHDCGSAGCAAWRTVPGAGKMFADPVPTKYAQTCAIPGRVVGNSPDSSAFRPDKVRGDPADSGPFCFCNGVGNNTAVVTCLPQLFVPEQINLQYGSVDTVVAGFVTYERSQPRQAAMATLVEAGSAAAPQQLSGVSHWLDFTPQPSLPPRNYTMHFVKFTGLKPSTRYAYQVKSGDPQGVWSESFTFRTARPAPDTAIAMYGDMAVTHYNAVSNLLADCTSGRIDIFAHMGDHAYDLGGNDGRHGDAYMNAMQPLLAVCPWVPIIGNHESSDGDGSFRYLNQTFGMIYANPLNGSVSSATSALSHLLTKGSYLAPGLHGTTPSGTSSYFSVDIGLIHITVISNAIEHNDRSPAELAWLTKDLEAANKRRKEVPWIIVTSHYPIFKPEKEGQTANVSLLGWYSEAGETCVDGVCAGSEYMSCEVAGEEEGCRTVAERVDETSSAIGTLFQRYGVDIYNAGHSHEYDVTWPMLTGKQAHYQQNFSNPQGTVYVTEGNGAVPGTGPNATLSFLNASYPYGRVHGTGGAYGIITTSSSDKLTYEHVWNNGHDGKGEVMDTWSLTEATHVHPPAPSPVPGPPGPPPTPPSPPAPPPTGWKWTCFSDKSYNPAEAGLQDKQRGEADLTACEQTCNGATGCVALRYHESSKHCHLSIGPPPTLAEFRKLLKPQAAYSSCIMLKQ